MLVVRTSVAQLDGGVKVVVRGPQSVRVVSSGGSPLAMHRDAAERSHDTMIAGAVI